MKRILKQKNVFFYFYFCFVLVVIVHKPKTVLHVLSNARTVLMFYVYFIAVVLL